jgi:hypothetical protein
MPICRCRRCGLIFAPETPAGDTTVCDHCLGLLRRGKLGRPAPGPRDAPLFRALARERRRASDPRCVLGLPAGPGPIVWG